ncbi:uncharacterized skeletal organic matrix protein 3-like isoform X2 [Orbicella faveolata]|nr:uncharacterized skeletal organic matrix protein 3-like isoform X2 [Orbicella faveolata]
MIKEQPNNFIVKGGSSRWYLQWNKGLDAKYSGLILKFDFACVAKKAYSRSQCLLVKAKGNYTLSEAPGTPPLQVVPNDVAVDVHVTGRKVEPTARIERNDTKPDNVNNVHPGETAADTEKKRKTVEKNNSVVVVGVCLSLVAGIALVCVLVLRRSGSTRPKGPGKAGARDAGYEEPVDPASRYAVVKRNSNQSFQNEFYDTDCVLSIEGPTATTNNTYRLGPLPPLPPEEGTYEEPMITRNVGYHGLGTEAQESSEQTKDEPAIKEEPPPVYNTLEPPSDEEDDYDDTAEPAIEEEPPPVYNTLEPPSDDEDDYDDTAESRCRTV